MNADVDVHAVTPTQDGTSDPILAAALEEALEDLARDMIDLLPLRQYKSGNTGVELHMRRQVLVFGQLVPISIHCNVVMRPGRPV